MTSNSVVCPHFINIKAGLKVESKCTKNTHYFDNFDKGLTNALGLRVLQ